MAQAQLPAHLQNRQVRSLTERASEGMGGSLPPHVSIAGNSFTFVDQAGNEFAPVLMFDAVIVDIADRMNKRYYDKPYDQTATTYEPPRCWSANGITPTREVATPIHPTCEGCPANVRGSAISKMTGAAVKACRDEKWIAFIVPQMPTVLFQLVITPGSFTNWKAYTETMRAMGVELSFALTRFSFAPKTNGVLMFENVGWIDEGMLGVVEAANREGKTDALVGRSDPVRQPALAAPVQAAAPQIAAPVQQEVIPPNQFQPAGVGTGAAPAFGVATMTAPQAPFGAAAAPMTPAAAPQAAPAGPVAEAAPRRRRRSAADAPAAAPAAPAFGASPTLAPQAPFGQAAQAAPAAAPQAPFGQAATPQQNFGISAGAPVNPEMLAMLEQMGFQRAPQ